MINFNRIKILIGNHQRLIFLMVLGVISSLLEAIGLGSIASLIYALLNDIEIVKNKVSSYFALSFVKDFSNTEFLNFIIIAIFSLFLIKNLFKIVTHYLEVKYFQKIYANASATLFKNYINLYLLKFVKMNFNSILNDITIETKRATKYLSELLSIFKNIILIVFLIFTLLLINWKITISSFMVISILIIVYNLLFRNKSEFYGKKNSEFQKKQFKIALEPFQFFKFFATSKKKKKFFSTNFLDTLKIKNKFELKQAMLLKYPASYFELSFLTILLLISFILYKSIDNINQVISIIGVFSLFSLRMISSTNYIYNSYQVCKYQKNSLTNIEKKIDSLKISKKKKINSLTLNQIEFKNIFFKYPDSEEYIIKNFNLKLKKNKILGIFGPTGCGKSTLLDIMLGLIEPSKGQILINNERINLFKSEIEDFFSYLPQKSYIFNDTIRKNILLGDENNKKNEIKINNSLKKAEISKFIKSLPKGLSTICKDSGKNLSGGQAQRISLARSLYLKHEILIMDEATSALDNVTEEKIFKNLKKDISQTIIFVSHNKKLLKYCDYFYDFKK